MKPISLSVMALFLAGIGTACGARSMSDPIASNPYADVKHRAPPQPELKRNPTPTPYEITVTLKDAPGPFASIKGFMQYETKLADPCLPDLGGMAGTRMRIKENVPFELQQVNVDTYRGVIYTDLFEDHDYFGLGSCHVGLVAARVELRPTGATTESAFVEYLSLDEIQKQTPMHSGFLKRQYPAGTFGGASVPSFREGTQMRARVDGKDLFGIELVAHKRN
ncbi:hypothetical protein ARC78_07715 [Stenotrophomonas pictorum JCM 9942]|uniref:Lipoprotein n=1 Tax=Stenotrophomonas pictorum JCM 9942 TaxID=1236960 RepID=A0A0R0APM1_9GAMM|nr:hypothetical protein [Stenotrophomonas pictorum]KRG42865.1 hypothetical protein ARC78_07715 [Stenotrophomonas pictorum JCM 9942]